MIINEFRRAVNMKTSVGDREATLRRSFRGRAVDFSSYKRAVPVKLPPHVRYILQTRAGQCRAVWTAAGRKGNGADDTERVTSRNTI